MQYRVIPFSEVDQSHLSWWQSSDWADILRDSRQVQDIFYFGCIESSIVLVEIRSVGIGFFGAFSLGVSVPQMASDWDDMIIALRQYLRSGDILFLQIEPLDIEFTSNSSQKPYKKFLTPHTRILDLSEDEDAILAQTHEKGRYNIRTAIKRGVTVERVEPTPENIDIWMNLLDETTSRDGFAGNSKEYYEIYITKLQNRYQGGLYFARFEGRVIAAAIFVFTPSRAIYYYGASSSNESDRKVFAPYLLQWEAIRIAKNLGIPQYDFLGVADPSSEHDPLAGVSFFKSRFGGDIVVLPPKILYSLSWKYSIFALLQTIKNLLKRR